MISMWNFGSNLDINGMINSQLDPQEVIKHLGLSGYLSILPRFNLWCRGR